MGYSQTIEGQGNRRAMELDTKFKKVKEGAQVYQQSKRFTIDSQNPPPNLILPQFSESEISEAFKTLDMSRRGFLTTDDLGFFLNVLEAGASDAEIEEMIRMLDYEGSGRVYFQEFFKLATGKSLNPIGQGYPPTTELLTKKKTIEGGRKEEGAAPRDERGNATQDSSRYRPETTIMDEKIPSRKISSPNKDLSSAVSTKLGRKTRSIQFEKLTSAYKIGPMEFRQLHSRVRHMLGRKTPTCRYGDYLDFLGLPRSGDDPSWELFNQLVVNTSDNTSNTVDIR